MLDVPPAVKLAYQRAAAHDFGYSCEPLAGRLLATLSAAVPPHGRILELGTGVGAGLGWIAHGLAGRDDVTVVSVENDERTAEIAARGAWPASFELRIGDAERLLPVLGSFDLLFADAQGGKWSGLDLSVAALAPGGVLLVDDMDPSRYAEPEHVAVVDGIRRTLTGHEHLVTTELPIGSGLILATRRR
jgi:predicted O-methyltransferase YrrM